MKRKAFTLVELLVVVAIIALLISILAPSLKSAKDLAKQVICSTNLHGLGSGVIMYAEANRGQVPPSMSWNAGKKSWDMSYLLATDRAYALTCTYKAPSNVADIEPETGKVRPNGVWSILLYYGQVAKSDMLMCPANTSGQLSRAAYPEPYGTRLDPSNSGSLANGIIKCCYPYNPHSVYSTADKSYEWEYTKLDMFPSGAILTLDAMYAVVLGMGGWHQTSGETSPTWVRGYPDGHAAAKTSASEYTFLNDPGINCWVSWEDFDKALGFLE